MDATPDAPLAPPTPPIPRYERVAAWVLVVIYAAMETLFVSVWPVTHVNFLLRTVSENCQMVARVWRNQAFLASDVPTAMGGSLFGLAVAGFFIGTQMLARGLGRRGWFAGRALWCWILAHLSAAWSWWSVLCLFGLMNGSGAEGAMLLVLAVVALILLIPAYVLWPSRFARLANKFLEP
jgi:hypothetical protein